MNRIHPPRFAQKMLHSFLREDLAEEVQGDLDENFYSQLQRNSASKAKRNYWYQVLHYLRPFAIRKTKSNLLNPFFMFRHNLIVSFRNFTRYKTTFLINLFGLSVSLTSALLIYLWVYDEMSIDNFHKNDSQLFQVLEQRVNEQNAIIGTQQSTPWLLSESLAETMPEVEYATVSTQSDWFEKFTLTVDEKNVKASGRYTGKDFFNVFSFPLVYGDKSKVLTDKSSIVISEELAKRLFNTVENAMNKSIEFQHERLFTVSGIFKEIPANSSIQFDFALSVDLFKDQYPQALHWKNAGPDTYIVLRRDVNKDEFETKIKNFIQTKTDQTHRKLHLAQFSRHYLHGNYENGVESGGRIEYVRLFSYIAVFILAIACINFMNLATARASRRTKEIGIKKAVGAYRSSIIFQHLFESFTIACLALVVALFFTYFLLPQFNLITDKHLSLHLNGSMIGSLLLITGITGLLAGSYPALYLSGFKPAAVLKGKLHSSLSELWTRKGLVVFQFVISIIFIVSVWVVYQQIAFVQNKNIGYNRKNVIYFEMEGKVKENPKTFLTEIERIPGVQSASTIGQSMVGGGNNSPIDWEGKNPEHRTPFAYRPVNYGVIEMMELELIEGRSFSRDRNDSLKVIFNETGIATMGMEDPIGKIIKLSNLNCEIIGVVKDFHFESMHDAIKPMFFILVPPVTRKVIARIDAGKEQETLAGLQTFYQKYNPGFTFDFHFLDQDFDALYASEQRIATLSRYFAGLAVLISALGLFGLAAFTAERRQKEIGIRKVMGSSELNIIYLLSADFTKIVLVAIAIAIPISYFITNTWLNEFAYHISLKVWLFAGSGLIALVIAWLTVGLHAFRASRLSPVKCLKEE